MEPVNLVPQLLMQRREVQRQMMEADWKMPDDKSTH